MQQQKIRNMAPFLKNKKKTVETLEILQNIVKYYLSPLRINLFGAPSYKWLT